MAAFHPSMPRLHPLPTRNAPRTLSERSADRRARTPPPRPGAVASLEAREQEARRIARDLHDEAGQMLAAAHVALDELAERLPERESAHVERVRSALRMAEDGLRHVAHDLRPMALDDLGLGPALELLGRHAAARHAVEVRARIEVGGRLAEAIEIHLYRIAQEALTNAVRHGGARHIEIRLALHGGALALTVRDDGQGMAAEGISRPGLGLRGMRERAELLGGRLIVDSVPGRGTTVTALVPIQVHRWPPFVS